MDAVDHVAAHLAQPDETDLRHSASSIALAGTSFTQRSYSGDARVRRDGVGYDPRTVWLGVGSAIAGAALIRENPACRPEGERA
jgi:hypothetical protein